MKGMIRLWIIMIISFYLATTTSLAAPPPTEVEEKKNEAPLHLIGTVIADELFKDISKSEQYPQQVRTMNLKVDRLIKVPNTEKEKTSIEAYYWYIPSWQAKEYTGGERMDIAVGDVIEIWLVEGEYGWEPALGGNTVNHIKYAENRKEPIPEPFLHSIERKSSSLLKENTEALVLVVLSLVLFLIVVKARKSKK
ncbi:hypothetical protein V7654_20530 [Bacillus sp. JJ1609]|uniref:hypothetical protein n=1 Tax=Bacillus sp. JJ1609 TaxID=3122977 RepID=UPI003000CA29